MLHAVLEQRHCLRLSSHFYFYILVRQVFRRAGITDRAVADYVAELLSEFSRVERNQCTVRGQTAPLEYFFEMMAALQTVDESARFFIRAHIGNASLFLSGIFPERIRFRAERKGFPSLRYYEELGRSNYRVASDHRLAREYDLAGIFHTLAERFQDTRKALNDLGDRLITLGDPDHAINAVLKKSLDLGL